MNSVILTATGKWFDVLNPDPALIDLADILGKKPSAWRGMRPNCISDEESNQKILNKTYSQNDELS